MKRFGGIEAGGTKFVCSVGTGPDDLHHEIRFPTTTPEETIGRAITYFKEQRLKTPLSAIGISSFGPIDLDPKSARWGNITSTPKAGWEDTDFARRIGRELGIPVAIDTDVNGAAFGEYSWGAAQGLDNFVYFTIGTGIGGGGIANGKPIHGLIHPEMGHILLPPHPKDPSPQGFCPFHKHCFEGMASGTSIEKRWGMPAEQIPLDHSAWEIQSYYLSLGIVNIICTLSPQRVVLGGGVMEQQQLFPLVRKKVQELLNNYIRAREIIWDIEHYIVPPGLGNRSGILGSIALAAQICG